MSRDDLLGRLRTQEAHDEGTDVRLVLLEALMLDGRLHELDNAIALYAGGNPPGLLRAERADDEVLDRLAEAWKGFDLQEQTMTMRELDNLVGLLIGALSS